MSRAANRAAITLRAVRILKAVVGERQKLSTASASATTLPSHQAGLLRDVCSGTLRHLDYYSRLVDWHAPSQAVDDLEFRLLAAASLYQYERTQARHIKRNIAECCDALGRSWASPIMSNLLDVVPHLSDAERGEILTDASELSLPPWLHRKLLRGAVPLDAYAHSLLERPDFLCVCVPPSQGGRASYIDALRQHDP